MSKDRYGLISVDVVLDDRITNFEIIADGYAWHDQEYEKSTLMPKRLRNRKSLACGLIRILYHQGSFDFNRGCQSDWIRLATQSTTADAFAMVIYRSITLLLILGLFCGCGPSLRDAAEQGDAKAQYTLGNTYQDGDGVEKDSVEAVKWFRKSAEQGFAGAQNNLGNAYQLGTGVPKDSVEAVKWFRKPAEQGYADAQCYLGDAYELGAGVPKDALEAYAWYNNSAVTDEYAKAACSRLEKTLSPQDIARAQSRSTELLKMIKQ